MKQSNTFRIDRIEPPCWWVGMKTPLQLMLYGENLRGARLVVKEKEDETILVSRTHQADSPDYLFADVMISEDCPPGSYLFELHRGEEVLFFDYPLKERREGSAERKSFSASDMIYLLFTDRFSNGNPDIDSTPDTHEKADRKEPYARHGGDLYGVINHLDYLVNLGVTTLWLTPPQLDNEKKQSYHGYACADYYRIDPRLGNNELYQEMVRQAHAKGLKVIMDAVPNHCGTQHWWMKNLPFTNWIHLPDKQDHIIRSNYRLATITDPNSSRINRMHTVHGWFDEMMPDMAMENPYVFQYLLQLYVWWIEWADLDGLRVDTFPYNDKQGISRWTHSILEEYPNLNIVAECWHSSPAIVAYWQGSNRNPDGYSSFLPSVMDFPLQEALSAGLSADSTGWMEGMNLIYETIALDFLYPDTLSLMTFLDNHDIGRFADSVRGNKEKIKIGITMLATLRGIPQLYYGTEFGFRSNDPLAGHGEARKDFPGGWKEDRKNLFTGKGMNKAEQEIYQHTCKLFNWRKKAEVIHKGLTTHFLPVENTYGYVRYTKEEAVFVFLNPTRKIRTMDWNYFAESLEGYSYATDILSGEKVKIGSIYKIQPHSSVVLELYK